MLPSYLTISAALIAMGVEVAAYWSPLRKAVPLAQPGDHVCQQIAPFREPVIISTTVLAHHRIYYVACGDILKLFTCTVRRPVYRAAYKTEIRSGYKVRRVCCPGHTLKACSTGYYGINCDFRCPQLCLQGDHGTCRPMDGQCTCMPGYHGVTCDEECPSGRYGPGCTSFCQCPQGATCNSMTGACLCNPSSRNVHCLQATQLPSGGAVTTSHMSVFCLLLPCLLIRLLINLDGCCGALYALCHWNK
ncbi:multiple epidermal growth factor-like domains protein 11 isoform X2 [Patiria miniata]|uniref:Multiple epidermal growth factor-like domains protein 10 n=1 Tax=Patiria miniata TaxID=46514 RepID=A0A913Z504_PATMI|nr:multiple epidermal growth factor-like domains protein 11 isoform X2 [Patiria miniata]